MISRFTKFSMVLLLASTSLTAFAADPLVDEASVLSDVSSSDQAVSAPEQSAEPVAHAPSDDPVAHMPSVDPVAHVPSVDPVIEIENSIQSLQNFCATAPHQCHSYVGALQNIKIKLQRAIQTLENTGKMPSFPSTASKVGRGIGGVLSSDAGYGLTQAGIGLLSDQMLGGRRGRSQSMDGMGSRRGKSRRGSDALSSSSSSGSRSSWSSGSTGGKSRSSKLKIGSKRKSGSFLSGSSSK